MRSGASISTSVEETTGWMRQRQAEKISVCEAAVDAEIPPYPGISAGYRGIWCVVHRLRQWD